MVGLKQISNQKRLLAIQTAMLALRVTPLLRLVVELPVDLVEVDLHELGLEGLDAVHDQVAPILRGR